MSFLNTTRGRIGAVAVTLLVAVGGAVLVLDGEDAPERRACTLLGCVSGVEIHHSGIVAAWPAGRTITVCAGGVCSTERLASRDNATKVNLPTKQDADAVRASLRVADRRGKRLYSTSTRVQLRKIRPNGPDCGPTCIVGSATFDAATRRWSPR